MRMYEAKAETATTETTSSMMPAWAFPLFGVVAMFSFAAFVGVRRRQKATRQVAILQPVLDDEESLLADAVE